MNIIPSHLLIVQAVAVAQKFSAQYVECSSLKNDGVREAFEAASRAALHHPVPKKGTCIIN